MSAPAVAREAAGNVAAAVRSPAGRPGAGRRGRQRSFALAPAPQAAARRAEPRAAAMVGKRAAVTAAPRAELAAGRPSGLATAVSGVRLTPSSRGRDCQPLPQLLN